MQNLPSNFPDRRHSVPRGTRTMHSVLLGSSDVGMAAADVRLISWCRSQRRRPSLPLQTRCRTFVCFVPILVWSTGGRCHSNELAAAACHACQKASGDERRRMRFRSCILAPFHLSLLPRSPVLMCLRPSQTTNYFDFSLPRLSSSQVAIGPRSCSPRARLRPTRPPGRAICRTRPLLCAAESV